MEKKREVKTFEVDFRCPKCNIGYLRPTGIAVGGYPIRYPHVCNNPECDYHEIMKGYTYPYIVYEPIDTRIRIVMDGAINTIQGRSGFFGVETERETPEGSKREQIINNYVCKPSGK